MTVRRRVPILMGRRRTHPHVCRTDSRHLAFQGKGLADARNRPGSPGYSGRYSADALHRVDTGRGGQSLAPMVGG
jgi:hypothetical protein